MLAIGGAQHASYIVQLAVRPKEPSGAAITLRLFGDRGMSRMMHDSKVLRGRELFRTSQ